MATATLTHATVKYPAGTPRETQFGDRINVLLTLGNGEETRLWGKPGDASLTRLKRGDKVQLLHDGKNYKLIDAAPLTTADQLPEKSGQWSDERKREIAAKVQQSAKLLRFCYQQAQAEFPELDAEHWRQIATTLFIQATR